MVMPRCRSSGALSIDAKSRTCVLPLPDSASTFVIAAVSVVLPWSMCPMVPTFTCGFERSNFCLAIPLVLRYWLGAAAALLDDPGGDRLRHFLVPLELHGEVRA